MCESETDCAWEGKLGIGMGLSVYLKGKYCKVLVLV